MASERETAADWTFGSGGFCKIYGERLAQSSLLDAAVATRWVFVYMLGLADATGRFRCATVTALARAANVTLAEARKAIRELEAPDEHSTTKAHEGRRLLKIQGGWQIVNYLAYREFRTKEQESAAERKRRQRGGSGVARGRDMSRDVTASHGDGRADVRRETSNVKRQERTAGRSTAPVPGTTPTLVGSRKGAEDVQPAASPLVSGRRGQLEVEWLRHVRTIAAHTGQNPEDVPPEWDGRRGIDPARLSEARLLRDVMDMRKRWSEIQAAARPPQEHREQTEPARPLLAPEVADSEISARRERQRDAAGRLRALLNGTPSACGAGTVEAPGLPAGQVASDSRKRGAA